MIRKLMLASIVGACTFTGCKTYTHPHFKETRIEKDVYTFVYNDGYAIQMQTPGDLQFTLKQSGIRKALKQTDPCVAAELKENGNILWHGKTLVPPHYEFWTVAEDGVGIFQPNCKKGTWSGEPIQQGPFLFFIGLPQTNEAKGNMTRDLTKIIGSLKKADADKKE